MFATVSDVIFFAWQAQRSRDVVKGMAGARFSVARMFTSHKRIGRDVFLWQVSLKNNVKLEMPNLWGAIFMPLS